MNISPDTIIYWQWGPFQLSATIVFTWAVMLLLVIGSILITRNLSTGQKISRWQSMLETIVSAIRTQIAEMTQQKADPYIAFLGTLFLFI